MDDNFIIIKKHLTVKNSAKKQCLLGHQVHGEIGKQWAIGSFRLSEAIVEHNSRKLKRSSTWWNLGQTKRDGCKTSSKTTVNQEALLRDRSKNANQTNQQ
ncbi:hypothetical protein CSKR_106930 [Clonorchis sinensis]|uniref:Uncharacterized protein n=1 Tax=Clonorchis sinensis TaxID=79923 RepID=A0A3R7JTM4_CLOSI|nr:hypothetical protein CSKR_106930 [Clonorchis sinensis]